MSIKALILGTVISAKILPNTIFLEKYKKIRAAYNSDVDELPVSTKLMQRFQDVMNDLRVPISIRRRIKIFHVHDIRTFRAGSTMSSYGAIIGVPPHYEYDSVEHASVNQIGLQYKHVAWANEDSDELLESLVLSENAQKFAIAREVLRVQRFDPWIKTFSVMMDCLLIFGIHDILYVALNYAKKTKIARYMFKIGCIPLATCMWLLTEQIIDVNADRDITEQLSKLGPKYIQGGKEFYEKLCKVEKIRDKRIRAEGLNPEGFFKKTELPASEQKEFFTIKLQELEDNIM